MTQTSLTPDAIAAYIAAKLPDARHVRVDSLMQIPGGASRQTFRFRLAYDGANGPVEQKLILRRDPPASLIDTERKIEYAAYHAFRDVAGVPVPKMLWLEDDASKLDGAFFIAEEISGFESGPMALLAEPYLSVAGKLAERKWTILGEIARADPAALGLTGVMETPAPDACWRRELAHWEAIIDEDELEPQPIMRAAIRWLRANPPKPAQKISVVHGDYRSGNFLYDAAGEIHGILDWEMSHLGDPLEDLGWSLNRIWCWAGDDRYGALTSRENAIGIWERASGLTADPADLHWWELFNCVKGQGIWISSAKTWTDGTNREPILAFSTWRLLNAQDRAAMMLMERL